MLSVVQRVSEARVVVAGDVIGEIGAGLLVLVCAERGDTEVQADKLLAKLLKLRIFSDDAGKMNRSLQDVAGGLLLVSQFTLAADVSGGNRPSFTNAAAPDDGALASLGAGPVEGLLATHAARFGEVVDAAARTDDRFRTALRCAWYDDKVDAELATRLRRFGQPL